MGYLDNTSVVVDAILTKKGRELLSRNDGSFQITQFSLSDDEVDYTLYNPNHPSGSAFYGEAIEAMPVLEAFPDDNEIMKYKLITLPRGTAKIPVLDIGYNSISLKQGASLAITPQTLNYLGATSTFEQSGYIATIGDVRLMSSFNGTGINTAEATAANSTTTIGTNVSKTVIGASINLTATTTNTLFGTLTQLQTNLIVIGRDSGARITIPITIIKQQ
jgi:hypothetical protein